MTQSSCLSTLRLVNGSTGDPVLYMDSPGRDNAVLFDGGDNARLSMSELADLHAVFITHHHVDHFIGLDRIVRANLDRDKTVQIYGPPGTIQKVYDRIRSYEYPFFPFQKIVLRVHDVRDASIDTALLECTRRFPEPELTSLPRSGRIIYETPHVAVESISVDHTVPCLAFAMVEKPGWYLLPDRLLSSNLRPGRWCERVPSLLRAPPTHPPPIELPDGTSLPFEIFRERYCVWSDGARVAFVTDTAWSPAVQQPLTQLAHRACRLYGDCFYSREHAKSAAEYRHMTTDDIADLARRAEVDELVLIHFSTRYVQDYQRLISEVAETFPRVTAELPRPG